MENGSVEYALINSNGITILNEVLVPVSRTASDVYEKHDITTERNLSKGTLSRNSCKRLRNAINNLAAISPGVRMFNPVSLRYFTFRISFITLTLSAEQGIHSDNKIKRQLLNHFIIAAKRKFGMKSYVWKAESQLTGNIHFHIATNTFIHHQDLRDTWNNIQKKLGYIDLFNDKHSHINPNSTDIHQRKRIDNLAGYLSKYFSKDGHYSKRLNKYIQNEEINRQVEQRNYCKLPTFYFNDIYRSINGRLIGYSDNLGIRNHDPVYLVGDNRILFDQLLASFPKRLFSDTYYSFLRLNHKELSRSLLGEFKENYCNHLQSIKQSS